LNDQLASLINEKANAGLVYESSISKAHTDLNDAKASLEKANEATSKAQRKCDEFQLSSESFKKDISRMESELQTKVKYILH